MRYFRTTTFITSLFLLSFSLLAEASKPPKLAETSDKIFQIANGLIVVPAQDRRDQLTRPDLRRDGDKGSSPLPSNFQTTFFDHEGLQKYPVIWIFSPKSGKVSQIKSADLRVEKPDWGESTGVLENIYLSAEPSKIDCADGDCLAIVSAKIPFKSDQSKRIEFSDPPKGINAQTFGIQESDFGATRLNYSKRPNGSEIVIVQTYKNDADVNCGGGGIANTDTGYVRSAGGQWYETYSKFTQMDPIELTKSNVSNFGRPRALVGVPAARDEVISIESTFIFLDKKSAAMTPIREPSIGVCGC